MFKQLMWVVSLSLNKLTRNN